MIIEHLMKLDIILKIVGCSVTKKLDHNIRRIGGLEITAITCRVPDRVVRRIGGLEKRWCLFKIFCVFLQSYIIEVYLC